MNARDSSKQADIRHESELIQHFRQLIADEPDLRWQIPPEASAHDRLPWAKLKVDDRSHRFKPVYSLRPSIPELESLVAGWKDPDPPLLVVPELSSRVLDFCRNSDWQRSISMAGLTSAPQACSWTVALCQAETSDSSWNLETCSWG